MEKKQTRDVMSTDYVNFSVQPKCSHTAVVRLPESEARGIGLSACWQGQVEEQSVSGSWEVKLIQHQPADSSVHRILQQY